MVPYLISATKCFPHARPSVGRRSWRRRRAYVGVELMVPLNRFHQIPEEDLVDLLMVDLLMAFFLKEEVPWVDLKRYTHPFL